MAEKPSKTPEQIEYDFALRFACFLVPILAPFFGGFFWASVGTDFRSNNLLPLYVASVWGLTLVASIGVRFGAKSPKLKRAAGAALWGCLTMFITAALFFGFFLWAVSGIRD